MFSIRLSTIFSADDYDYDIQLPEVPAVGDTIRIRGEGRADDVVYRVKARQFDVGYFKNEQIAVDKPMVLLHVVVVN